ncbi:TPA: hypothetical protein N0J62_004543 [Salmonella enterica subsp. enterica serovar Enteritidis]|uniref:Uncharacterized protein n=1 Tax=Salmonella enteritidis TaxID=149539 RepID=A0A5U8KMT2_SALEN|nr:MULTISPECIES: hypothetical protein [Enterobacteriaceae]EAA5366809.1 hypothetical protein [Salmonella enterica subsp. enterica serovar Enteritidis]EAR7852327.1 hypothetical protein [Salmonella enterica]EAW0943895.1 hypothetical protein [Salmonella enterica subsp. enterica serovar Kentucky]EBS3888525.1 hypothetical protein [Salmonella enterica subsp. enterica serovar Newport]ECT0182501.1 hypothetical protein [Salmonella enterica subsp. enterica serovar Infantis]EEA2424660.1 hypothetical prot
MKIENIQEEINAAFEDKRIVVVRGGNMSHRDELMLSLKDLNIEGIDNIVFYNDSNITKAALKQVMSENINTLFVFDHLDISISEKTYDKHFGGEVDQIRGIGYSYFAMVNDNSYAHRVLGKPSNNNKVLSFTNENVFLRPYLEQHTKENYGIEVITIK